MEVIVLFTLVLVVVVKAGTIHKLNQLEASIRSTQNEEVEVSQKLHQTESTFRQLEQEHKSLTQEIKHLENDKDLASLEVTKLGGKPLTESQLDQLLSAKPADKPIAKATPAPSQTQIAASDETEQTPQEDQPASQTGAGSPVAGASGGKVAKPGTTNGASSQNPSGKGKQRILVVDDNNELRSLLLQALENDYEVLESPDGFDALTKIIKEKQIYDLVITDLNMPKVNGITFLENLPDDLPTIIISAFIDKPEFKQALAKIKPTEILQKPFQMAALRRAIQKALPSADPAKEPPAQAKAEEKPNK